MRTFPHSAGIKFRRCHISIICAEVNSQGAKISADCLITFGDELTKSECGFKLRRYDDLIIGFVGSADVCANFTSFYREYKKEVEEGKSENIFTDDLDDGMIVDFFTEFYRFLKYRITDFSSDHCAFIIAYGTSVFTIEGYTVLPVTKYAAIGSGATVAYAAMDAGADTVKAVKSAIRRNGWCGYPIETYSISKKGKITHKIIGE